MIKLSLFMSVNQAYFNEDKKSNICKRLFQIFCLLMACFTIIVQFILLDFLWEYGLGPDTKSIFAKDHPDDIVLDKTDLQIDYTFYSMVIAMVIVMMLIGVDLHEHMKVIATWKDYTLMMWKNKMPIAWLVHLILLILQC
jgi:hypothetical protein